METKASIQLDAVVAYLISGKVVVMVGPFGSGKSLSLREIWIQLKKQYTQKSNEYVPVAVNLREHWGAEYADEILRRHARSIGFREEQNLIVAWRAGMLTLLIDGFDELASQGVANVKDVQVLKQIRMNALVGAKDLISKSDAEIGILITGRDHYFDDMNEMKHALGLLNREVIRVKVEEFDEPRAKQYLGKKGLSTELPDWLPRKALLLGYLAREKLLEEVLTIDGTHGQAKAWYSFISLICKREAEHDRAEMDAETVQNVLENLAMQVRTTITGVGPISSTMLAQAYIDVTTQTPGDAVLMQLQRLPGLTERDSAPGSRSFVDQELLDTLQGTAIFRRLIDGGFSSANQQKHNSTFKDHLWVTPLSSLACSVAILGLKEADWKCTSLFEFIRQYSRSQLGADLLRIAMIWGALEGVVLDLSSIDLNGVHIEELDLDEVALCGLRISDSVIDKLVLGSFTDRSDLIIADTHINCVQGAGSKENMHEAIKLYGAVEIQRFDLLQTTDAIVGLDLDPRKKALLVALKKLFRQRGAGRVSGAFHRGLPLEIEKYVDSVLHLLVTNDFAWKLRDVYHPNRKFSRRANQILDNPHSSGDPIIGLLNEIKDNL